MITTLRGKDYIATQDWTADEIESLLEVASDLKRRFALGEPTRLLMDKTLFMIFFDKSTRTRNAFEAGMTQLGGHAHDLNPDVMQISHGESPRDTGIILSRYGHGIAIRHDLEPGAGDSYIREVALHADVPVINLQSDVDHPTQTLADLMTMREKFPKGFADGRSPSRGLMRPRTPSRCRCHRVLSGSSLATACMFRLHTHRNTRSCRTS